MYSRPVPADNPKNGDSGDASGHSNLHPSFEGFQDEGPVVRFLPRVLEKVLLVRIVLTAYPHPAWQSEDGHYLPAKEPLIVLMHLAPPQVLYDIHLRMVSLTFRLIRILTDER